MYGRQVIQSSRNGICVLFGNVAVDWSKTGDDGRVRKYNAFLLLKTAYSTAVIISHTPIELKLYSPITGNLKIPVIFTA